MINIRHVKRWLLFSLAAVLLAVAVIQTTKRAGANQTSDFRIVRENNEFVLSAGELGAFHRTPRKISDARLINLPETGGQVFVWNEETGSGSKSPHYAISLDGKIVGTVRETSYEMLLRYGKFDPLVEIPSTADNLTAKNGTNSDGVYIVQFVTQPLNEYRDAIKALGGETFIYLPNHAYIVKMNTETSQAVSNLPFVRWVGNYHPAYKIEEFLHEGLANRTLETARYNIMVLQRGSLMQNRLANKIRTFGGKIDLTIPEGFRLEATLTAAQVVQIANEADVLFIDRWSAPESDMSIVRDVGGANFIENNTGY
jgi:hypothetical protein